MKGFGSSYDALFSCDGKKVLKYPYFHIFAILYPSIYTKSMKLKKYTCMDLAITNPYIIRHITGPGTQNVFSSMQVKKRRRSGAALRLFGLYNRESRQAIGVVICKTMYYCI